jgi:hypothetical protein
MAVDNADRLLTKAGIKAESQRDPGGFSGLLGASLAQGQPQHNPG